MNTAQSSITRLASRILAVAVLAGAFTFAGTAAAASTATDVALRPMADKAATLPLKATFSKDASGKHDGPYVLELTNESAKALKVSATVDLSVVVHNRPKSRSVAAQTVEPGKSLKIEDLSVADKVTVTAEGFEPLQLTVPAAK